MPRRRSPPAAPLSERLSGAHQTRALVVAPPTADPDAALPGPAVLAAPPVDLIEDSGVEQPPLQGAAVEGAAATQALARLHSHLRNMPLDRRDVPYLTICRRAPRDAVWSRTARSCCRPARGPGPERRTRPGASARQPGARCWSTRVLRRAPWRNPGCARRRKRGQTRFARVRRTTPTT